jgi:hypothetical protein
MYRITAMVAALIALPVGTGAAESRPSGAVRGADELFWVPTLDQALDAARETGKPIFVMGYSLVDERSTFTKLGNDYPQCVF